MKIGMLTGLWFIADSASALTSLTHVAALGFRYVDMHGTFHAGPSHLTPSDRAAIKSEMATLGLRPRNYVLHAPHNLASATEAQLEDSYQYLTQGINLALDWGMNQLMLNAGQWTFGVSREDAWTRAVRFIQRVCDYASPRDFYIALETEPYVWFLVNDIASTVRMLSDVDRPNLVTLVDLGHMALARESGSDLARLSGLIVHAHLSEHQPLRHTNQIVGTGFVPVADYIQALESMDIDRQARHFGYDEFVLSFELGVPGDQIDDPDSWVRRSLENLRQVTPSVQLK